MLSDEVQNCIKGISISLSTKVHINFDYENNLPLRVIGNVEKFRLAIMTLLEFSIKYCAVGSIRVKVNFDSWSGDR